MLLPPATSMQLTLTVNEVRILGSNECVNSSVGLKACEFHVQGKENQIL